MHYSNLIPKTSKKLKLLFQRIEEYDIPSSRLDESLNRTKWNIRDFGNKSRCEDGIVFIAQILHQFDLRTNTEEREDFSDFKQILKHTGTNWEYVLSDWQNDRGVNYERSLFLLHQRMVYFTGLPADHGGVIDFARDALLEKLFPDVSASKRIYGLSDHFPIWNQIDTNNEMQRLDNIITSP
ncbi:hypothetical protein ACT3CD_00365 [Geofilum sp. OHC36d9]|uniref:hypothetical protein n=1 Tax=Geofilum sp. OHC36d9 TaxID=3458413 RepID=UPI0040347593